MFYSINKFYKKLKYSFLILLLLPISSIFSRGAGVLPYTKIGKAYYILLGKEYRNNRFGTRPGYYYSEFGGAEDRSDRKDIKMTAAREFSEETKSVYGKSNTRRSINYIYKRLSNNNKIQLGKGYTLYPANVSHIPAAKFNRAPKKKHSEKSSYVWIHAKDLLKIVKSSNSRIPKKYDRYNTLIYPFFLKHLRSKSGIKFLQRLAALSK